MRLLVINIIDAGRLPRAEAPRLSHLRQEEIEPAISEVIMMHLIELPTHSCVHGDVTAKSHKIVSGSMNHQWSNQTAVKTKRK